MRCYNVDHRHSGIGYVSPQQRHAGDDRTLLAARHAPEGELGNAHAHALFDRLAVGRADEAVAPARAFGAYSVSVDGRPLAIGESITAASGVTLHRRC